MVNYIFAQEREKGRREEGEKRESWWREERREGQWKPEGWKEARMILNYITKVSLSKYNGTNN